jgi:alpha-tubulin suppressor-like RCC1 family protein
LLTRYKLKSSTPGALFLVAALLALLTAAPRADQPGWKAIEAGGAHTCALRWNGTVRCWGANDLGQLGNNATASESIPVDVSGLNEFEVVAISAGHSTSCAVLGDGTARCWGNNTSGQLGNGDCSGFNNPLCHHPPLEVVFEKTPVQVGLGDAVEIGNGLIHTCALLKNGTVRCWGGNGEGQLGRDLGLNPFPYPVEVSGLTHAIAISVGDRYACALLKDGKARCWGHNTSGQLGNGSTTNSTVPVDVVGLKGAVAISAGALHTCAALASGAVLCWGRNYYGQLGNGSTTNSTVPVAVAGLKGAVAISAGALHTCAALGSGAVRCWGANQYGQLGIGTKITGSKVPVGVPFLGGTRKVTAGSLHTCALLNDGTARCWGRNFSGQLGNGTTIGSAFPVTVLE